MTERNNTGIESSPPPSCEDLEEEARTRPKSIRLLPRICSDALRLVWAASPRGLVASVVLKVVGGLGLAAALLLSRGLVASILSAGAQQTGVGAVAPKLAAVVGVIVALGLVAAAGREVREVLSENTVRHAKQRIIEVTTAVELSAYETPAFHNRLVRATAGEHRPIQLVDGLIGTVGAVAGVGGIVVALLAIQPWLVPLLLLAGLPLMAAVLKAGQAMFSFQLRMTPMARARDYLFRLLTDKAPAKEVRAFGLTAYLSRRHTDLYDAHMHELRRTARHRFRIAVAGTLGLAVALGAGITGLLALAMSGRLGLAETATAGGALLLLGERIMTAVVSIGEIYEAGLFVEDYTSFLATAPVVYGARAPCPHRSPSSGSASSRSPSPTPPPKRRHCATSRWSCRRARSSRWSGRTARGRQPSPDCSPGSTCPTPARSAGTALTPRTSTPTNCAGGSPSSSRTSPTTTSPPGRTSVSAPSRRSRTSTRSGPPPLPPAPTATWPRCLTGTTPSSPPNTPEVATFRSGNGNASRWRGRSSGTRR